MSNSKRREDTCHTRCPFWKRYGEDCPNFVAGVWESQDTSERYETHDCAPKRTMILSQQIYDVSIKILQNYNEVRNANHAVLKNMMDFQQDLPEMIKTSAESTDVLMIEEE